MRYTSFDQKIINLMIFMLKIIIVAAALATSQTLASSVSHLDSCKDAFTFSVAHPPGTKFTCVNDSDFNVWDCKVVIAVMFSQCKKGEQCRDFKCKYRGEKNYTSEGAFNQSTLHITKDEGAWLLQQIQVPGLTLQPVLLYQASRDGWNISDYNSRVNGFNNTYQFFRFQGTNYYLIKRMYYMTLYILNPAVNNQENGEFHILHRYTHINQLPQIKSMKKNQLYYHLMGKSPRFGESRAQFLEKSKEMFMPNSPQDMISYPMCVPDYPICHSESVVIILAIFHICFIYPMGNNLDLRTTNFSEYTKNLINLIRSVCDLLQAS